jgi:hypothetical protein
MGKKGDVEVNDLCLARFNTRYYTDEVRAWQEMSPVITAESCAAQVLYGEKSAFHNFPHPENAAAVKMHYGGDAYKYLLELVSGLKSKRLGETHVRKQFKDGWTDFGREKHQESISFQNVVSSIKKDINYIEQEIGFGPKDLRRVTIARDISGQVKGDTVLIIPSVGKTGKIGEFTKDMIFLTENKQDPAKKMSGRNNFLRIMPHNFGVQESMNFEVSKLKEERLIRSSIGFVNIKQMATQFEECDRVYLDLPMGADEVAERAIIDVWKNRARTGNTLTHIRGNPHTRMESTPLWKEAELEGTGYISPEKITLETTFARQRAQIIAQQVEQTIEELAFLRAQGHKNPYKILVGEAQREEAFGKDPTCVFVVEPE